MTATNTYVVGDTTEECDCEQCGYPLFVGETVYTNVAGETYCSAACRTKAENAGKENEDDQETIHDC